MATLWQQQDGGYALLWKRYDNNDVQTFRWRKLRMHAGCLHAGGPYKYISKKVVRVTTMWLCDGRT